MSDFEEKLLKEYADVAQNNNTIPPELYNQFNVKRGLRNPDGTGVLTGLTEIGDVHGYVVDEGEKSPCEGRLRYRGIGVDKLVSGFYKDRRFGFEEVVYLLLFGKLPNENELNNIKGMLGAKRTLPEYFTEDMILKAPSENIMNKLARSVLALYSYDDNPEESSVYNNLKQCISLIARFPVLTAYAYHTKQYAYENASLIIHPPEPDMSTAETFLHMIRPDNNFTQLEAELLDLSLVLHAEHGGGNNSSFTVHVISSAATDTYTTIAAAIGSLKGYKHGGANIRVCLMMDDIKQNVKKWDDEGEVADYIAKIIKKEAYNKEGLVYGMGHAVYTLSDPRAILLKAKAKELAKEKGREDELNLMVLIERLTPEVFSKVKNSKKVISANVDFYSGFVYSMLNIPRDLYTPLFAIGRIAGWSAHRIEEIVSGGRILRPAYKNVSTVTEYVPLSKRK